MEENKDTLRNRLIVTGAKEIADNGIAGFSLRKIATQCGISCAAPYKHFKDKREFIAAIIDYVNAQWRERQDQILAGCGVSARVVKLNVINPLDEQALLRALEGVDLMLVAEEVCERGCMGERILACLQRAGRQMRGCCLRNLGSGIVGCGSVSELYKLCGLDGESLATAASNLLKEQLSEDHEESQT